MLLKEYKTYWIQNFADIKFELDSALINLDYRIEHVGSTSVPDLASKPIIDIDIIHQNDFEFDEIKNRLLKIGYYYNGNQGIEDREVFKRNGIIKNSILDNLKHHLYVCPSNSKALRRHILFRDYLRRNDSARIKYQNMKYKLAKEANQDKKLYANLKELSVNDFIDSLIEIES